MMRLGVTIAAAIGMLLASPALAQGPEASEEDDPRVIQARGLFEEGRHHFDDARYRLAAESFQRAYDLLSEASSPRAGTILYNVATSLDELPARQREARDAYTRFLEEAPRGNPQIEELRYTVEQRIRELDLSIAESEGAAETSGASDDSEETSISPIGPIVLASGGALLIAGAIAGGVSLGQASDVRDACPELTGCPRSLQDDYDSMRGLSLAADVLIFGGLGVAAVGAVLTFTLRHGDEEEQHVAAACGVDGCRVVATGSF